MIELDDYVMAVPVGNTKNFREVIKMNESAAEIMGLLKEETTEERMVAALKQRYGDDAEIDNFVHESIMFLRNEGALE